MLGGARLATPKQIQVVMNVQGLHVNHVKSHLQKYRLSVNNGAIDDGAITHEEPTIELDEDQEQKHATGDEIDSNSALNRKVYVRVSPLPKLPSITLKEINGDPVAKNDDTTSHDEEIKHQMPDTETDRHSKGDISLKSTSINPLELLASLASFGDVNRKSTKEIITNASMDHDHMDASQPKDRLLIEKIKQNPHLGNLTNFVHELEWLINSAQEQARTYENALQNTNVMIQRLENMKAMFTDMQAKLDTQSTMDTGSNGKIE